MSCHVSCHLMCLVILRPAPSAGRRISVPAGSPGRRVPRFSRPLREAGILAAKIDRNREGHDFSRAPKQQQCPWLQPLRDGRPRRCSSGGTLLSTALLLFAVRSVVGVAKINSVILQMKFVIPNEVGTCFSSKTSRHSSCKNGTRSYQRWARFVSRLDYSMYTRVSLQKGIEPRKDD
jgi:hypothetical protein